MDESGFFGIFVFIINKFGSSFKQAKVIVFNSFKLDKANNKSSLNFFSFIKLIPSDTIVTNFLFLSRHVATSTKLQLNEVI